MKKRDLWAASLLCASLCAQAQSNHWWESQKAGQQAPQKVPASPDAGQAQEAGTGWIHLYRPRKLLNNAITPGIFLDGVERPAMPSGGCMKMPIETGAHTLNLKFGEGWSPAPDVSVSVANGQTVYARVETGRQIVNALYDQITFDIVVVSEGAALREMKRCKQIDPIAGKKHKKSWFAPN